MVIRGYRGNGAPSIRRRSAAWTRPPRRDTQPISSRCQFSVNSERTPHHAIELSTDLTAERSRSPTLVLSPKSGGQFGTWEGSPANVSATAPGLVCVGPIADIASPRLFAFAHILFETKMTQFPRASIIRRTCGTDRQLIVLARSLSSRNRNS